MFDPATKKNKPDGSMKGMRWGDMLASDEAYNFIVKNMILTTRKSYPIVDRIYQIQGYPNLKDYSVGIEDIEEEVEIPKTEFNLDEFLSVEKTVTIKEDPVEKKEDPVVTRPVVGRKEKVSSVRAI